MEDQLIDQSAGEYPVSSVRDDVCANEAHYLDFLRTGFTMSLEDLTDFQRWIGGRMVGLGMEVEEFVVDHADLVCQPTFRRSLRDSPSVLHGGTNVVGRMKAGTGGPGVLLYAHADKRPETHLWGRSHPEIEEREDRLYGPGIADDVAGITAMLSAIETYLRVGSGARRDLLVGSILGKQWGVFGTYGLVDRYGPLNAAIYVHPAESGSGLRDIKMASNGIMEFCIEIDGRAPDMPEPYQTLFAESSVSAIEKGIYVYLGLKKWADDASQKYRHPGVDELAGRSFALSLARLQAGDENRVFEVPVRCVLQGTVSFPPGARLQVVQEEFEKVFAQLVSNDTWLAQSHARHEWGDLVSESAQSDEESEFLLTALEVVERVTGRRPAYYYGHTISDIRYPILYWSAQTLGIGPLAGDIGRATEWVSRKEYLETIMVIAEMLRQVL